MQARALRDGGVRLFVCSFVCRLRCVYTSNSDVAERPRDASCPSVVSFNSTLRRAQSSVISYFRFRFTVTYNKILFSSLLFVVVVMLVVINKIH